MRRRIAAILSCLVVACSGPAASGQWGPGRRGGELLARSAAAPANRPVPTFADIPYGSDPRQTIDVYVPTRPGQGPTVVMVHGGGWRRGDKNLSPATGEKAAHCLARGSIFVAVNYRVLPTPPDLQAADVARALALVERNVARWGADPSRIVLMGHSAGGHLVALLSAHPAGWAAAGLGPWSGTVVLDSAAIDLVAIMERRHARLYDDAFGRDPAYWQRNSPLHQLADDALPMLIACSSTRMDNPCANARSFVARGRAMGKNFTLHPEPKNHGAMNRDFGRDPVYTAIIDRFIRDPGS